MARPLQFERQKAIDAAMRVFWQQGYSASSLQQLLDAMQINRGSLYAAFSDKAGLFKEVIDNYQSRIQSIVIRLLSNELDPAKGIKDVFELTLLALTKDSLALGCLLVNTVNELSPIDSEIASHAAKKLEVVEQAFITACKRAQTLNQMTTEITPESAGKMLMTSMIGLRVQSRRGVETSDLRQSIVPLLNMLMPTLDKR
ncbi:MAG: TetR/AcrR family transcriptional regulator [Thalassolituus sp.]|uniref:TetR/AcrR family transcriptional regulator n=1 Tax=Thalassolituus sp. TaxID=2030822 RepID=UPI003981F42D